MLNILFDYLTAEEKEQYQKAGVTATQLENLDSLDEYQEQSGRRQVIEQIARQRYKEHFIQLEDDPLQPLQEDFKAIVRETTKAEYDSRFTTNAKGETIFSWPNSAFFGYFFSDDEEHLEVANTITSHTKQGFIEYVDLKSDTLPIDVYFEWAGKQRKKDPNFEVINAIKAFNSLGIIEDWAEEQYKQTSIQVRQPHDIGVPTDKFTAGVLFADWIDTSEILDQQIGMIPVQMEGSTAKKNLTLYFDVDYPTGIPKEEQTLTPTDKRIYNATYWLQQENQSNIMTYTQLFKAAKFGEKPNKKQLDRIKKSVEKMRLTSINWNNSQEAKEYKKDKEKYPYTYSYKGYLYPVEIIEKTQAFNGKLAEGYINVLKPLPLMEFSKERGQFAIIPANILETQLSLTDQNIAMQDYLIKRIEIDRRDGKKKSQKERTLKVVYETLYNQTGATTRAKQRTQLTNLFVYLDELKGKDYIKGYEEDKEKGKKPGVKITYKV